MSRTVTIGNERISLALALPEYGMPEVLSFGFEPPTAAIDAVAERSQRVNGMDAAVPSGVLLPTGGMGFFGWPAIAGHRDGCDFLMCFEHWQADGGREGATLTARDPVARLTLALELVVHAAGVIAMSAQLTNDGDANYTLDRMMAASIPVAAGPAVVASFGGMWSREFRESREPLGRGIWLQESRRGRTSHDRFPGLFIVQPDITTGMHFGWSGNHVLAVDPLDDGRRMIHCGELFEPGEMQLLPGETYATPVAYVTAAPTQAKAAARLRAFVAHDLVRWPAGSTRQRPVTLNTWEGNYFAHDLGALKAQADAAAALGIERFVLDDGWFGRRDDDSSSLGDWFVDRRKYPDGLGPLATHVRSLGMEFGIWVEPEMVNPDSDLYRAHPDWALQVAGRPLLTARRQLVLDLTRQEVTEYLFERLDDLLRSVPISYVKWDMNRDLTHSGDRRGRAATARQTRAVYALMDDMRAAHPDVEIESCASGGGRADYGVLAHTHRLWTSDGTDALERLETQRGAAQFFPPAILGAHVSAAPNHQTHRRHTLSFRAVVALAYHFGIELDPTGLSADEAAELGVWIVLHKRLRPLLHGGGEFHLPPEDGRYVWGAAGETRIALFVAQGPQMMSEQPPPLKFDAPGARDGRWRIAAVHPANPDFIRLSLGQRDMLAGKRTFSLETLRRTGLPLPMLMPEAGCVVELDRVGEETHG